VSSAAAGLRACYDLHGVRIDVRAAERAVMEAIELRLRGREAGTERPPEVELHFKRDLDGEPDWPEPTTGRPVYDTPYGSLHYFADEDALCGELGGVRLLCEPGRGRARLVAAEFTGRALYFATHPLATVSLMELMERRGRFSLHAGCLVAPDGRGALLAGPSGAGKSTLALALARAGMGFLSDDVVFLREDSEAGAVRALGFADAVGVSPHAAACYPELRALRDRAPADGFPKQLARIEDLFGAPAVATCEPAALVFSEVASDGRSRIAPLDPGDAFLRLVPDVLLTDPDGTQAHLRAIAALLDQVDCFELRSGDLDEAAGLVRELVSRGP
jgi:hypothetical protein